MALRWTAALFVYCRMYYYLVSQEDVVVQPMARFNGVTANFIPSL